jgi:hypothetical protein
MILDVAVLFGAVVDDDVVLSDDRVEVVRLMDVREKAEPARVAARVANIFAI